MITMLFSKIHRATVTDSQLNYEGSCAIGDELLKAAGILEYQQIEVYNVTNGERFTTYAIRSNKSGEISVRGAAVRKVQVGDTVIIATYAVMDRPEPSFKPNVVYVDYDEYYNANAIRSQ